jgi:3-hydroxymyristoyl/3-hydroxydecanoyl-(acyl carrier protein) dehydratase
VSSASAPSLIPIEDTFLPLGRMRQISRVTLLEGPRIEGHAAVEAGHWVYDDHFPGDPIYPGSLMIEAAGQLVALWAWAAGHRGRPRLLRASAAYHRPVSPGLKVIELKAHVTAKRHLQFGKVALYAGGEHVAGIEAVLTVLPPLSCADPSTSP